MRGTTTDGPSRNPVRGRLRLLGLVLALPVSGCASRRLPAAPAAGPVAAPAPPVPSIPDRPQPVYRDPKIAMVVLRAHRDAQGRLFGPQVMYEIVDPGGWNVAAADGAGAYIPAADAAGPPPAAARLEAAPDGGPLRDPSLVSRVIITGLTRPEDRAQAEAMAWRLDEPYFAAYDREAGWLLVPSGPDRR